MSAVHRAKAIRTPVTVLLPTHDHVETLECAVGSVLDQSLADFTLIVVGDGVSDETRDIMQTLIVRDERIVFVDVPKTPRHAERVRHEVLTGVESPVIGYQGDDDVLLIDHLERMVELLEGNDFVHPLPILARADGRLVFLPTDLSRPECVAWHLGVIRRNAVSLTGVVHTLESYRRLPYGWRQTPGDRATDHYMWEQYFGLEGFRGATGGRATTVKLTAADRSDWTARDRRREIEGWLGRSREPGFAEWWRDEVAQAVRRAAVDATIAAAPNRDDRETLESVRADLARVRASASWRVTAPLRRVRAHKRDVE